MELGGVVRTSSSSSLRDKEAEGSLRLRNFEPDWEALSERERKGREKGEE